MQNVWSTEHRTPMQGMLSVANGNTEKSISKSNGGDTMEEPEAETGLPEANLLEETEPLEEECPDCERPLTECECDED